MGLENDEKSAIKAIKAGDLESLKSYLERHPGLNCEFSNGKTGLYYVIVHDQFDIGMFLLDRGADPDFMVDGNSTLKWAILYDRQRLLRLLIEYGADVHKTDNNGDTPLIYATELKNPGICKLLIDRGANPLHKNLKGKRAIDYTGYDENSTVFQYLSVMEKLHEYQDSIPSMQDGPYITWESDTRLVMNYFEHDREKHLTRIREKTVIIDNRDTLIEGGYWDKNTYHIKQKYTPNPTETTTDGDIFVMGDIHGRHQSLVNILVNNEIIDPNLNWTFGQGQLVLLGDEFDRGHMVTETLWFLYELQIKARKAGGNVHPLLGNHEIMAMTGDHRYLHEKYAFFTLYTGVNYYQLWGNHTVLGRWLRSQNAIVQINDYLFVHAGISPQFAVLNYKFPDVNSRVRKYLNSGEQAEKGSPEDYILGSLGPFWYRGYGKYGGNHPEVTQEFIDLYLDSKGLKRMILGHNELPAVATSYNGKVISVDVAIDESGKSAQGLLISGDKLYICRSDGTKEAIE
jgi:hypothetical protein